jgi:hypothetical protein
VRAALVALCALGLLVASSCGGDPPRPKAPVNAVSFLLPSADGALVPIPQPDADRTVIDAFGPTCEPCREKVPALLARKAEIEAAGAKLVLVAVLGDGESTTDAQAALKSWGASSAFLVDRGGVLARELGLRELPGTFVIGRTGELLYQGNARGSVDDVVAAAVR